MRHTGAIVNNGGGDVCMRAGDHVESVYLPLNLAENLKLLYKTILHTHTHTHTHSQNEKIN